MIQTSGLSYTLLQLQIQDQYSFYFCTYFFQLFHLIQGCLNASSTEQPNAPFLRQNNM